MKITTFNPFIATSQVDETIKIFETLGFERRHKKEGIEIAYRDDTIIRMKDANGFFPNVLQSNTETLHDTVGIRINVADFDEAYQTLLQHGFKNAYGDETVDTKTSKAAMMTSPSGFNISIIQHIKKQNNYVVNTL